MEGRNIPLIIMLLAGSAVSIACIIYRFSLLQTLTFVFLTLLAFYLIGLIVKKIVVKINHDAETRAALLAQEKEEAEAAAMEEAEGDLASGTVSDGTEKQKQDFTVS